MSTSTSNKQKSYICDIFGQSASFNFRGSGTATSLCGLCATFFFIFFALWSIFEMGKDMIYKEKPETVYGIEFVEDPAAITISPESFNLGFGLQDPNTFGHYIDETIYKVDVSLVTKSTEFNDEGDPEFVYSSVALDFGPCTPEHYGDLADKVTTLELNNLYCFDQEQSGLDELVVQGRFESDLYQYISVKYSPCVDTDEITCASQEEIDTKLKGAYFAVYFRDMNINLKDYDNPNKGHIGTHFITFGSEYYKSYTLYVKNVELTSDIGWLMADESVRNFAALGNHKEDIDFRDQEVFLDFVIRVSTNKEVFSRSYIKLQDVFSEVDGLVTIFIIITALLVFPYVKMRFYQELVNDVFDTKIYRSVSTDGADFFDERKRRRSLKNAMRFNQETSKLGKRELAKSKLSQERERYSSDHKKQSANVESPLRPAIKSVVRYKEEEEDQIGSGHFDQESQRPNIVHRQPSKQSEQDKKMKIQVSPRLQGFNTIPFKKMEQVKKPIPKVVGQTEVVEPSLSNIDENEQDNQQNKPTQFEDDKLAFSPEFPNEKEALKTPSQKVNELENNNNTLDTKYLSTPNQIVLPINDSSIQKEDISPTRLKPKQRVSSRKGTELYEVQETESMEEIIKKNIETQNQRVTVGLFEYMRSFFTTDEVLKKKMELLHEGEKKIRERLDVFTIMKKLREVDKLKSVLLNSDQLILFENLPKQVLEKQSRELLKSKLDRNLAQMRTGTVAHQSKVQQVCSALSRLEHKQDPTEIDDRLLTIFGQVLE